MTEQVARRLLAALLARAVRDAVAHDPSLAAEARDFLAQEGVALALELGLDPGRVKGWLAGLAPLPYRQLTLAL